jgi:hypothetical protein
MAYTVADLTEAQKLTEAGIQVVQDENGKLGRLKKKILR